MLVGTIALSGDRRSSARRSPGRDELLDVWSSRARYHEALDRRDHLYCWRRAVGMVRGSSSASTPCCCRLVGGAGPSGGTSWPRGGGRAGGRSWPGCFSHRVGIVRGVAVPRAHHAVRQPCGSPSPRARGNTAGLGAGRHLRPHLAARPRPDPDRRGDPATPLPGNQPPYVLRLSVDFSGAPSPPGRARWMPCGPPGLPRRSSSARTNSPPPQVRRADQSREPELDDLNASSSCGTPLGGAGRWRQAA